MKNLEFLVGNNKSVGFNSIIPYHQKVCEFLADLSDELNKIKNIKDYPDIKTLAFLV